MLWDIVGLLGVAVVVRVAWSMRDRAEPPRPVSDALRAALTSLGFVQRAPDDWRLVEGPLQIWFEPAKGDSPSDELHVHCDRLPDGSFAQAVWGLDLRAWPEGGPGRAPRKPEHLKEGLVPGLDVEARQFRDLKEGKKERQVDPAALVFASQLLTGLPSLAELPGFEVRVEINGPAAFRLWLHWDDGVTETENRLQPALRVLRHLLGRLPANQG